MSAFVCAEVAASSDLVAVDVYMGVIPLVDEYLSFSDLFLFPHSC